MSHNQNSIDRRGFLGKAALVGTVGVAGALSGPVSAATALTQAASSRRGMTAEDFDGLRGQVFRADVGGKPVELVLTEVTRYPVRRDARPSSLPRQEAFGVTFTNPGGTPVCQDLYAVENATTGQMNLLIVPVTACGTELEAVFN